MGATLVQFLRIPDYEIVPLKFDPALFSELIEHPGGTST